MVKYLYRCPWRDTPLHCISPVAPKAGLPDLLPPNRVQSGPSTTRLPEQSQVHPAGPRTAEFICCGPRPSLSHQKGLQLRPQHWAQLSTPAEAGV